MNNSNMFVQMNKHRHLNLVHLLLGMVKKNKQDRKIGGRI